MSVKALVNRVMAGAGYRISRLPSLQKDIDSGKYRWLQEMHIATILDVGANVGQFAGMIRAVFPDAMIYSFEPLEECFRELIAKAPSLKPIQCFQSAVGKEDGIMTMHRNDFSASSSLLPLAKDHIDAFPFARRTTDIQVPVRSLDSIGREISLTPPILLKADIQGYELHMLSGAQRTLSLTEVLILEMSFVELYESQPLFHDVYQVLRESGFAYAGCMEQVLHPASGLPVQMDAVFRRREGEQISSKGTGTH